jgi:hypothetical protein
MPILSSIRYIRNYFSTSCFYITKWLYFIRNWGFICPEGERSPILF